MITPALALVLHAHLPWVRHPEFPVFYEESWLFEAIGECYLPLLERMKEWTRDGLPWRLSLTLSPTLAAMLNDPLLRARARRRLEGQLRLAEMEAARTMQPAPLRAVAEFYRHRWQRCLAQWDELQGDLIGAFARFAAAGHLEVLACPGSHPLLPLLTSEPDSIRAQMALGAAVHRRCLGAAPRGWWLPECGWTPELDSPLRRAGVEWFVLETDALKFAAPPSPKRGAHPRSTPSGMAVFGRDGSTAAQVWSRHGGYPGDPRYREFHYDLVDEPGGAFAGEWLSTAPGAPSGFKRRSISGVNVAGPDKAPYDRESATAAATEHADHFLASLRAPHPWEDQCDGRTPLTVAPYDAELFGHWWFEGPEFLDAVVRGACRPESGLSLTTPGRWLESGSATLPVAMPAASTWGADASCAVWLDPANAWMQPRLRRAAGSFNQARRALALRRPGLPLARRALALAGRELLLGQASDWPFLVRMGTAGDYPARRCAAHVEGCEHWAAQAQRIAADDSGHPPPALEASIAAAETSAPFWPDLTAELWPETAKPENPA